MLWLVFTPIGTDADWVLIPVDSAGSVTWLFVVKDWVMFVKLRIRERARGLCEPSCGGEGRGQDREGLLKLQEELGGVMACVRGEVSPEGPDCSWIHAAGGTESPRSTFPIPTF